MAVEWMPQTLRTKRNRNLKSYQVVLFKSLTDFQTITSCSALGLCDYHCNCKCGYGSAPVVGFLPRVEGCVSVNVVYEVPYHHELNRMR